MKEIILVGILMAMPVMSLAQDFESEVSSELDGLYQQSQNTPQPAQVRPAPTTAAGSTQIVIQQGAGNLPQTNYSQSLVAPAQKQPTTIIEASPLKESRAEQIRRSRQEAELMTEQKIVEKLEQSRMEDEKKRAEILFGDKFNQLANKTEVQQPVQQQPIQMVAPAPVVLPEQHVNPVPVAPAEAEIDREMIRGEVSAALAEMKPEEKKAEKKSYVSLLGGIPEYSGFKNVTGNYSFGVAFGQKIDDRFLVEGSMQYSNLEVQQRDGLTQCYYDVYGMPNCEYYPRITNMDQYNAGLVGKYHVLQGPFRPLAGAMLSYTYRTYTDTQLAIVDNNASSNAVDAGLVVGMDFEFSDNFALGVDYKYMWNMWYKTSSKKEYRRSLSQVLYGSDTPIERSGYSLLSVVGRATF